MLLAAIFLFALAALFGLYLLSYIFQNKNTPKGVVFTHGPLASIGLVILIIYAFIYQPAPIISIIIFILTALGGITLVFRDLTGRSMPKWLAIGHGLTAIIGFIFLFYFSLFLR